MNEKHIFSLFLLDCGVALLLLLLLLLLVIVEVFLMMEVLAKFWRLLNLPEARGPEGAPSPIRPPAARRLLSLELPCSSLFYPCSPLALPPLSACYPRLLSLCPLFALPMLAQAQQFFQLHGIASSCLEALGNKQVSSSCFDHLKNERASRSTN